VKTVERVTDSNGEVIGAAVVNDTGEVYDRWPITITPAKFPEGPFLLPYVR
jgi:hypothetical protein